MSAGWWCHRHGRDKAMVLCDDVVGEDTCVSSVTICCCGWAVSADNQRATEHRTVRGYPRRTIRPRTAAPGRQFLRASGESGEQATSFATGRSSVRKAVKSSVRKAVYEKHSAYVAGANRLHQSGAFDMGMWWHTAPVPASTAQLIYC